MNKRHAEERPKRETEDYIDDQDTPAQQGRAGGNLERDVGTRDLLKRARQDKPGTTRVRKSDEKGQGGLGGHHGTGED